MESETNINKNNLYIINFVLIGAVFLVLVLNQLQMNTINKLNINAQAVKDTTTAAGYSTQTIQLQSTLKKITPSGTPDVYGKELGVSYDDPVNSMNILNQYDDLPGANGRASKAISLESDKQQRYIKITNMIGCEFCCGSNSLTTKDGEPACACAHSGAMRGLAKYLLSKHSEMTDEQILTELVKWKILFFPQPMAQKYLAAQGIDVNTNNVAPSLGSNVPNQVGGC